MEDRSRDNNWEPLKGFSSPLEFSRFETWIQAQVLSGKVQQVAVGQRYSGSITLSERWFERMDSHSIWRLVDPDFPFQGVFEQVV